MDGGPGNLVFGPNFAGWVDDARLLDDACLDPGEFRFGRVEGEYRRAASATKTPFYFPATVTGDPVAIHFGRCFDLQIFQLNA